MHYQLPRAGRQSDPRGIGHSPRSDYHYSRYDQHADGGGWTAFRSAAGALGEPVTHTYNHQLGNRDFSDLSRIERTPQRTRRAGAAAQCFLDGLRLRGGTPYVRRRGQSPFKNRCQGGLQNILGYEELPLVSIDFKG